MMEGNGMKQNGTAGWIRSLVPLAIGLALGAFLYSRFSGGGPPGAPGEHRAPEASHGAEEGERVRIAADVQREMGIELEAAAVRTVRDVLAVTGTVREDPGRVAHIRPLAGGLIREVHVQLGDRVAAGDPLLAYDNIDLGRALGEYLSVHSELRRALADIGVKETILERSREMLAVGAIARTAFDLREAELRDARARAEGARARAAALSAEIRRFGWTDRRIADLESGRALSPSASHSVLAAPIAGTVTALHASVGETVDPSTELVTIADLSSLWVLADVFEKDLAQVRPGKPVRVRVAAYPGRTFGGTVVSVDDILDPGTRTVKVRCRVPNRDALLKVQMFADVRIPVDRMTSVLAVRDDALQRIDGSTVVFVGVTETEFERRPVRTGIASGGFTEIVAGLAAGERVVSRGSFVVKSAFLKDLIEAHEH